MTVGFAVAGHGLFPLTRQPRQEERDSSHLEMLFWQMAAGAAYISAETFRPPIWPQSSGRMPEELTRTTGPIVACRYGHRLKVLSVDDLDRMLQRVRSATDVVFLPAIRGCRM